MEAPAADRPYRRLVLRGTVATGLGNAWAMGLGLVTLPLLLHGLGAAAFGLWALLQTFSVTTGWLSLGDFGLTTSTVRFVAAEEATGDRRQAGSVAATSVGLFALLGLAWGGLLALLGPVLLAPLFHVPDGLADEFRLAVGWFALQTVADFVVRGLLAVLEGVQRVDRSRGVEMLRRTLTTGGAAVAAVAGAGLAGVAAVSALGTVVTLVVAAVVALRGDVVWAAPARWCVGRLARYGSAVAVLRPIGVLHRTMDRLIVGAVLGPSAVVLVEIATQIQNGAEAVLSAASYAVTPSASWLDARGDQHRLRDLVELGTRYTLVAAFPVVVVSALLAGPLIQVWVGAGHRDAVAAAALALGYTAVTAPLQVGSNLLVGIGRIRPVLLAAAVGLSLNLVLSLWLVHPLGPTGVFVATLVSGVAFVPTLTRAVLGEVGLPLAHFVAVAVRPPLLASLLVGLAVAVPVALPLGPVVTLVLGALAAVAAGAWALPRLAMNTGELRELVGGLRAPTAGAAA